MPIKLHNDLAAQRREIGRIKGVLRRAGLAVNDHPDDGGEAASAAGDAAASGSALPVQGNVYINGGKIYGPVIGTNTGDVQGGTYSFEDKDEDDKR